MFPVEERFTHALHGGARAWRAALERRLKTRGLTLAGWRALAAVAAAGQAPSQRELAQQLGVDGATLVSTIDRLMAGKLVERRPGPYDRRVKLVVLTDTGREVASSIRNDMALLRRAIADHIDAGRIAVAAEVLEDVRRLLEDA